MDKTVLIEKRKNLLGNSKNSAEIFLSSGFINVLQFFTEEELTNFIQNKAINELRIGKTDYAEKIKAMIKDAKNIEELQQVINTLHFDKEIAPAKDFGDFKNKLNEDLVEESFDVLKSLLEMSLRAKIEYYDTSVWTLYFCCGLLEGTISFPNKEDLVVRAPLVNVEIEIVKEETGDIVIHKQNDEQVANEILEMSIDMQLDKKTNISGEIEKEHFSIGEYLQYFSAILPTLIIQPECVLVKKFSKEKLLKVDPYLKLQKCFFVTTLNPLGGKMLRDYDELLTQDYQFPTYDTIFHHDLNHLIYDQDKILEINNPLNLVQKLAIVNSLNKNVLIYGPPGTGKSEVVANIIANVLVENKTTLVISEKKAALDVLDNRLQSLSTLSMSAFDEKNSDWFYKKIINLNHSIVASNNVNLNLKNNDYLNILQHHKILSELQKYIDINGKDLYAMMQVYDSIETVHYQRNIEVIRFIHNKLTVDKIAIVDFIQNIRNVREMQTYIDSVFDPKDVKNEIFNCSRISDFFNTFENVPEKDKGFAIRKFVTENLILDSKPIFQLRNKIDEKINVSRFVELFHKAINDKIYYVVNNRKIFTFINQVNSIVDYVSLYDWVSNTQLQKFIDMIKQGQTSNSLINAYWNYHILYSKKTDEIIRDKYINSLKDKLLSNHEIEVQWTELVRKANLSKRPNVNKIIKQYYNILKTVFPIWILSPDAATSIIPLNTNEFDYGIFDEASQMRIERGVPLVYRCRFSIVSGDDKQLRPSSFFAKTATLDESFEGHLDNVDSLLDKAKSSNWMSFTLSNHYRSISEQLINFSSHYFYNDELICITKNGSFKKTIDVYDEHGDYDREKGINKDEANRVIQCLLTSLEQYPTSIVVTFNGKQADYIQQLAQSKAELRNKIENLSLKVRSLENVQGDEADQVIISTTFGKDGNGRFLQNFGPINQEGGKNRINVMVTRAKVKMVVVKSFMSSDITNDNNENTFIFKSFISYVEQLQNNTATYGYIKEGKIKVFANDELIFINEIIANLKVLPDLVIEKQKRIGTHFMDLAISKTNNSNVSLCILIDGRISLDEYAKDTKRYIDNIDCQKYYEDRGYKTLRLNIVEWIINKQQIIKNIREQIV